MSVCNTSARSITHVLESKELMAGKRLISLGASGLLSETRPATKPTRK